MFVPIEDGAIDLGLSLIEPDAVSQIGLSLPRQVALLHGFLDECEALSLKGWKPDGMLSDDEGSFFPIFPYE